MITASEAAAKSEDSSSKAFAYNLKRAEEAVDDAILVGRRSAHVRRLTSEESSVLTEHLKELGYSVTPKLPALSGVDLVDVLIEW